VVTGVSFTTNLAATFNLQIEEALSEVYIFVLWPKQLYVAISLMHWLLIPAKA
jgi:hypothetical protein